LQPWLQANKMLNFVSEMYKSHCSNMFEKIVSLSRAMSDKEAIKVASTVGTAPLWVPVAAAGGLVYGAGKGKRDILDAIDKNKNKQNVLNTIF
jgi:hypothetical protein